MINNEIKGIAVLKYILGLYLLSFFYKDFQGTLIDFEKALNYLNPGYIRKTTLSLVEMNILKIAGTKTIQNREYTTYKIDIDKLVEYIKTLDEFKLCYHIILDETFVLSPVLFDTKDLDKELKEKYLNSNILYFTYGEKI